MPGVDFDLLRREITMQQVLDEIGFAPTEHGRDQLYGLCPVHDSTSSDKPNSRVFSVNIQTGRYYCHKCKSHGDQLELYAAVQGTTLYKATIALCRALGREIPWITRWRSRPQKKRTEKRPTVLRISEDSTEES